MQVVGPNKKNFITWFKNDKIKIEFDRSPKTETLDYPPMPDNATPEEIEERNKIIDDIDEKPYIVRHDLWVRITYKGKVSYIFIPRGYRWNGANIPGFAWFIIGTPDDPKFRLASMIHDWLCEHHEDARNDRYLSTLIFCSLCIVAGVGPVDIFLVFHSVDNFQKVAGRDLQGHKWNYKPTWFTCKRT